MTKKDYMNTQHTPVIRLEGARRDVALAERECPHWDFESDPRDHDCCYRLGAARAELRAAIAKAEGQS